MKVQCAWKYRIFFCGKCICMLIKFVLIFGIYQSLPEGHQQIEDVTVMYSSDFDWTFEGDEVQGSESEENGNDFEEFIEDDKDDGSITRIPEEEIKDILASSGVAKTEMINVFKMEGFNSPVKISVNNRSEFIIPEVGGKVFYKGKWISAGDAKTEVFIFSLNNFDFLLVFFFTK